MKVSLVVPAFNEEGSLASTVEAISRHSAYFKSFEIIVINDGSADKTSEIAKALPVRLIVSRSCEGRERACRHAVRARHRDGLGRTRLNRR